MPPTLVYASWHSDEAARNCDILLTFTPGSYGEGFEAGLDIVPGVTGGVFVHRTESRGYVRARSTDPFEPPVIQPNYFSDEIDQRATLAGLRLMRRILATPAFARYYPSETAPGEQTRSDDELLAHCREAGSSGYHPMGSCRMGPAADPGAVVGEELRVHGVQCLRVGRRIGDADDAVGQPQRIDV